MNTLRFFLLLLSVFFFAFVFQALDRKSGSQDDVLGEKSEYRIVISATPAQRTVLNTADRFRHYRYPVSTFVARTTMTEYLSSNDSVEAIVAWYRQVLQMEEIDSIGRGNQKQYLLMKKENSRSVVVTVKKNVKDNDVLIVVSITAS